MGTVKPLALPGDSVCWPHMCSVPHLKGRSKNPFHISLLGSLQEDVGLSQKQTLQKGV